MFIDKVIKREIATLIVSIIAVLIVIIGISYALFFSVDEGSEDTINIGDLSITFCADKECNDTYDNMGKVIGLKKAGGVTVPSKIYPYKSSSDALKSEPYIFNISNTGGVDAHITIKLVEDKEYELSENYSDYKNLLDVYPDHLVIAISNCGDKIDREDVLLRLYSDLENNEIKKDEFLASGKDRTYCLWTYLDSTTPNDAQNTYFVANLDFSAEYKPND